MLEFFYHCLALRFSKYTIGIIIIRHLYSAFGPKIQRRITLHFTDYTDIVIITLPNVAEAPVRFKSDQTRL